MKKAFVLFLMAAFIGLTFSSALIYIPKDYVSLLYIPDASKFYSALKKTEIGNAVFVSLGLENMVDSLLTSQLESYEIDVEKVYSIKEIEIVVGEDWLSIIVGPMKDFEKIKKLLKDLGIVGGYVKFKGENYELQFKKLESYGVFYIGNEEGFLSLKRKEGNAPDWIKKAISQDNVIAASYEHYKDETVSKSKLYIDGNVLKLEGEGDILDKEVKNTLSKLSNPSTFPSDMVLDGEGFLMVNVSNLDALKKLLEGFDIKLSPEEENILENFNGQLFGAVEYSESLINAMYSGEQTTIATPTINALIKISKLDSEMFKGCMKKGANVYLCGNNKDLQITVKGDLLEVTSPPGSKTSLDINKKAFKEFYTGKENIMVYLNFSGFINQMFGLDVESYGLIKLWYENGKLYLYGELR